MIVAYSQPAGTPPTRRWYQYSLGSLLLVTLSVSLGMSWVAVKKEKARRQKAAVEAILRLGSYAGYDYQVDASGEPIQSARRPAATWWRDLLGDDFFDRVVFVEVLSDAALEHVAQLPDTESLRLGCSRKVTDAGLVHLRGLSKLRKLWFGVTRVTDAGLAHLSSLHQLESLEMEYLKTTDAGLEHLQGLTRLQELTLGWGQCTDAGLVYLEGLTRLRKLRLGGGHVTDAGLEHLKNLRELQYLELGGPELTEAGAKKLQQALPNCKIKW